MLKVYTVYLDGMYASGGMLVVAAKSGVGAEKIANKWLAASQYAGQVGVEDGNILQGVTADGEPRVLDHHVIIE